MTRLFFRVAGLRFEAGELVFHSGLREFVTINGCSGRSIEVIRPNGTSYMADPVMVKRDVEDARGIYASLCDVDRGLARWFLTEWQNGASVADCHARLRTAFVVASQERERPESEAANG